MKRILAITILTLLTIDCKAQLYQVDETMEANFLIVYKEVEEKMMQDGISVWHQDVLVTKSKVFHSKKAALEFLNNSNLWFTPYPQQLSVGVEKENLIGIWDLSKSKRMNIELRSREMYQPKEVVIDSVRWVDQWYEIGKNK